MFTWLLTSMQSNLANLSNTSNSSSSENGSENIIVPVIIFMAFACFANVYMKQNLEENFMPLLRKKENNPEQNALISSLQQQLGFITKQCALYTKINDYTSTYSDLLKEQLEKPSIELLNAIKQVSAELNRLYMKLKELDENNPQLKDVSSSDLLQLTQDITINSEKLKMLLDQNDCLEMECQEIAKEQEYQAGEKDNKIQQLSSQIAHGIHSIFNELASLEQPVIGDIAELRI